MKVLRAPWNLPFKYSPFYECCWMVLFSVTARCPHRRWSSLTSCAKTQSSSKNGAGNSCVVFAHGLTPSLNLPYFHDATVNNHEVARTVFCLSTCMHLLSQLCVLLIAWWTLGCALETPVRYNHGVYFKFHIDRLCNHHDGFLSKECHVFVNINSYFILRGYDCLWSPLIHGSAFCCCDSSSFFSYTACSTICWNSVSTGCDSQLPIKVTWKMRILVLQYLHFACSSVVVYHAFFV